MPDLPDKPFEHGAHAYLTGAVAGWLAQHRDEVEIRAIYDVEGNYLPYLYVRHEQAGWQCWLHIMWIPETP